MKVFYQEFKSFPQAMDIIERNNLITPQNWGYIKVETLLKRSNALYPVLPYKSEFTNFYDQMISIITDITKKPIPKEMIDKTMESPEKIKEIYDYGSFLNDNFYIKSIFEGDTTYLQILDGYPTFFHNNYEYNYHWSCGSLPVFFKNLEFVLDKNLSERKISIYSFVIPKPENYTPKYRIKPTKGLHFKIKHEDQDAFLIEYNNPQSGKHIVPRKHFICQDCGKIFYTSESQQKYFLDRKLKLPKRCEECRDLRKADKNV